MKEKFTQKDYILYSRYYNGVLDFFKKELKMIKKSGKKTLWYHGAWNTFGHLKKERGRNLTPHDIDIIIYVLLNQIQEKQKKKKLKLYERKF
jgi:hypothetical protein